MKQVEDFILLLLWGIACSGIITGLLLGDRFVFGVLGITSKPQGFPEYTVLSVSVILVFLLIIYHIVRNSHRKKLKQTSFRIRTGRLSRLSSELPMIRFFYISLYSYSRHFPYFVFTWLFSLLTRCSEGNSL